MNPVIFSSQIVEKCCQKRKHLVDAEHQTAFRVFNGFYEGLPGVIIDIYAKTIVISDHTETPQLNNQDIAELQELLLRCFPWAVSILLKIRNAVDRAGCNGKLIFGSELPKSVTEAGVKYALNLTLNQDDSFYLDTRNLRDWLKQNMGGKTLLNTFAYTGTLGVAAMAGGAVKVIQTDNSEKFLRIAKNSSLLNNNSGTKPAYLEMDFFRMVDRFKTSGTLFDCVILDPPFFSQSRFGKVDIAREFVKLINKVRPLIAHEGCLIAINNGLYVPGNEVIKEFEKLSLSGYIELTEIIPVPEDVCGYPDTVVSRPPVDPAPYNHATKISILNILRKDKQNSNLIND